MHSLDNANINAINTVPFLIIFYYKDGMIEDVIRLITNNNDPETIRICLSLIDKNSDPQLLRYLKEVFNVDPKHHEVIDLFEKILSPVDFDSKIIDFITSGNTLQIEAALIYIIKSNKIFTYNESISKIKLSSLKITTISFLVNIIRSLQSPTKAPILTIFNNLSYNDLDVIMMLLNKIGRQDLLMLLKSKIEVTVHTSIEKLLVASSKNNLNLHLDKLKHLYFLLGNEKEYYIVEEYSTLSVASS
jgi:hypothetical protein